MHRVNKPKASGELTYFTRRLGIAQESRRHAWPCAEDAEGQKVADLRHISNQPNET